MSRAQSSEQGTEDNLTLSVDFEGLLVTVSGPSERALDFVRRLSSLRESSDPRQDEGYTESSAPPSTSSPSEDFVPLPCPEQLFDLGRTLFSRKYSSRDRIERAWTAGQYAGAYRSDRIASLPSIKPLRELPDKVYVVLRSGKIQRAKVFYNTEDLKAVLGDCTTKTIWQGFASRVEARIYCQSFGEGVPEELLA